MSWVTCLICILATSISFFKPSTPCSPRHSSSSWERDPRGALLQSQCKRSHQTGPRVIFGGPSERMSGGSFRRCCPGRQRPRSVTRCALAVLLVHLGRRVTVRLRLALFSLLDVELPMYLDERRAGIIYNALQRGSRGHHLYIWV